MTPRRAFLLGLATGAILIFLAALVGMDAGFLFAGLVLAGFAKSGLDLVVRSNVSLALAAAVWISIVLVLRRLSSS